MFDLTDIIQEESDRQATLLALAALAHERPGWDHMLGLIADKLQGREMYNTFLALRKDGQHGFCDHIHE